MTILNARSSDAQGSHGLHEVLLHEQGRHGVIHEQGRHGARRHLSDVRE